MPLIVVLPFESPGGDAEQGGFAVFERITVGLQRAGIAVDPPSG